MLFRSVATIQPMVNTFYTLVFVASGLFLLASTALLGKHRSTESWIALALGVLVLTMHSRYYVAEIGGWFGNATESAGLARFAAGMDACYFAITGTVGLFLLWLAIRNHFAEMKLTTEAAPA